MTTIKNRSNSDCRVCGKKHRPRFTNEPERELVCALCLDCHGELESIGPYVYRCKLCHVKHGDSFAIFTRSNTLQNERDGKVTDYSHLAVLSLYLKGGAHPKCVCGANANPFFCSSCWVLITPDLKRELWVRRQALGRVRTPESRAQKHLEYKQAVDMAREYLRGQGKDACAGQHA